MSITSVSETNEAIRNMVRVVRDDGYIASYLGVPVARVTEMRNRIVAARPVGVMLKPDDPGIRSEQVDVNEANRAATIALGKACVAYMVKHHPNSDVARLAA